MIEVTGIATIVDGRKDAARESALQNAFRRAVEQAVGVLIESETVVKDFELVKDRLSSKSAGFIRRYSISSERCEGDQCRVEIKAQVSKAKLEKELDAQGLLIKKMGKPRMVMLISEQGALQDSPSYWWGEGRDDTGVAENAIMSKLLREQFSFVDRRSILAALRGAGPDGRLPARPSNDDVLRVLSSRGAEVAIIGQAVASVGTEVAGTSFKACQATVSARALNMDSGEILASYNAQATVPHVNASAGGAMALEKAAAECAERLQRQIVEKWKKRANGTGMVKLLCTGLDYGELRDLKETLKERLDEVEEIYERSYKEGRAEMELEATCGGKEIASGINGLEFGGKVVKVLSVSANVVEVTIAKK